MENEIGKNPFESKSATENWKNRGFVLKQMSTRSLMRQYAVVKISKKYGL